MTEKKSVRSNAVGVGAMYSMLSEECNSILFVARRSMSKASKKFTHYKTTSKIRKFFNHESFQGACPYNMDEFLKSHDDLPNGRHGIFQFDDECDDTTLSTQMPEESFDKDLISEILKHHMDSDFEELFSRQDLVNKNRKKSFLRRVLPQQCNSDIVSDCFSPSPSGGNKHSLKLKFNHTSNSIELSDSKTCITAEINPSDDPCKGSPLIKKGNSKQALKSSRRLSESTHNRSHTAVDSKLLDKKSKRMPSTKSQLKTVNDGFQGTEKKDANIQDKDSVLEMVSDLLVTWIAQDAFTNYDLLFNAHSYQIADVDIEPSIRSCATFRNNLAEGGIGQAVNGEYKICDVDDQSVKTRLHRVDFDYVEIREYERIIGDHPWCSYGPPISIGWNHHLLAKYSLDEYETMMLKSPRRTKKELYLPARKRIEILKTEWRCSEEDIGKAFSRSRTCHTPMRRTTTYKSLHTTAEEVECWRDKHDSGKQSPAASKDSCHAKLLTNNGSKFARPVEPTKRIRAEI